MPFSVIFGGTASGSQLVGRGTVVGAVVGAVVGFTVVGIEGVDGAVELPSSTD